MEEKGESYVALDVIARLEELVDQLLADRKELQERYHALSEERDRPSRDRSRVSDELDKVLGKLECLGGKKQ